MFQKIRFLRGSTWDGTLIRHEPTDFFFFSYGTYPYERGERGSSVAGIHPIFDRILGLSHLIYR